MDVKKERYKYLDEINEAVLRQFSFLKTENKVSVLDVGCGTGVLSEAIQKRGYEVSGIELNPEAAKEASQRINKVINADLSDIAQVKGKIGYQIFDYIIFADILEHIYAHPLSVLQDYLNFLKDSGYVIISFPNTVAWLNRIMFLFGRFDYTDTGIMDKDHVRFFTLNSAKRLIKDAGCRIVKIDYIPYFIRALQPLIKKILLAGKKEEEINRHMLLDMPLYQFYMRYLNPIEYCLGYCFKGLFAFKIVIVAKKANGK